MHYLRALLDIFLILMYIPGYITVTTKECCVDFCSFFIPIYFSNGQFSWLGQFEFMLLYPWLCLCWLVWPLGITKSNIELAINSGRREGILSRHSASLDLITLRTDGGIAENCEFCELLAGTRVMTASLEDAGRKSPGYLGACWIMESKNLAALMIFTQPPSWCDR